MVDTAITLIVCQT